MIGILKGFAQTLFGGEKKAVARAALQAMQSRYESVGVGFWDYDGTTKLIRFSREAAHLYNLPENSVVTLRAILRLTTKECRDEIYSVLRHEEGQHKCTVSVQATDGSLRWIKNRFSLVRGSDGSIERLGGVATDVTEVMSAKLRSIDELHRLDLALTAGEMGSWEFDFRTNAVTYGDATRELFGLPNGHLAQGEYLKRLHPDDAIASRESLALAVKNHNENWYCDYRSTHPQKGPRRISVSGKIIYNSQGDGVKAICIAKDVTEEFEREQERQRYLALIQDSQELAHIGSWEVDWMGNVTWSPECFNIHGISPGPLKPFEENPTFVEEEHKKNLRTQLDKCMESGTPFHFDYKIVVKNEIKEIRVRGRAVYIKNQIIGVLGSLQDVTAA